MICNSKIWIRILTGDSLETAKKIALDTGIITEQDAQSPYCVMTGEALHEMTGSMMDVVLKNGQKRAMMKDTNREKFKKYHQEIKVVARCSPYHKFCLIVALQSLGGRVACTGESIQDIQALNTADVGLCMGSGCTVAKEAADIIIEEDKFQTIFRANQWGRNVS